MPPEDKAIQQIKSQLTWDIDQLYSDSGFFKIRSDREKREHKIYFPRNKNVLFYNLDLLHEYVHALYSETLIPHFTINGDNNGQLLCSNPDINDYLNAAMDWFVAGHLVKLCKQRTLKQMGYDLIAVRKNFHASMPVKQYLIAGLVSAQSEKWLKKKPVPGDKIKKLITVFLKTNPEKIEMQTLYHLTRELFNVFGEYEMSKSRKNGIENWTIEEINPLKCE